MSENNGPEFTDGSSQPPRPGEGAPEYGRAQQPQEAAPQHQQWEPPYQWGNGSGSSWYQSNPPRQATSTPAKKKEGGKLAAGAVALALLAGAVGGGTGIAVDRHLGGRDETSASQPAVERQQQQSDTHAQPTSKAQQSGVSPDWTAVADAASESVVAITVATSQGGGQGSGVVIDAQGNIVTNNHVVAGARRMLVTLGDQQYEAETVGTDPATDLAVIRLTNPPADLTPMAWGDSNALGVGDPVMAIGNPLGLSGTVTTGIVSALDRPVTTQAVGESQQEAVVTAAIQTNAAINPGNSGGALVNGSGELVGITTSIASLPSAGGGQSGNIGIGFAIGADQAKNVAEEIIQNGKALHPQVGVTARDVQEVGPMGAEVVSVVPGSPAAGAGLQAGDIIKAVNDRPVSSTSQLVGLVRAQKVGEQISVTFVRSGKEQTVQLTPVAAEG